MKHIQYLGQGAKGAWEIGGNGENYCNKRSEKEIIHLF